MRAIDLNMYNLFIVGLQFYVQPGGTYADFRADHGRDTAAGRVLPLRVENARRSVERCIVFAACRCTYARCLLPTACLFAFKCRVVRMFSLFKRPGRNSGDLNPRRRE